MINVKRIISGIVLLLVVALILLFGNTTIVSIAISAVALITINEYFNSYKNEYNIEKWVGNIVAILLAFVNILPKEVLILIFPSAIAVLFIKVIITRNENKLRRHCNIRIWNNIYYWIYYVHTTFVCYRKRKIFNMVFSNSCMGN